MLVRRLQLPENPFLTSFLGPLFDSAPNNVSASRASPAASLCPSRPQQTVRGQARQGGTAAHRVVRRLAAEKLEVLGEDEPVVVEGSASGRDTAVREGGRDMYPL